MNEPEARHRLAAILAADAAGYSRVMAEDDRVALATLDAARAVFRTHIEAQGGRVIDTAGDSVLASFEAATGAVRAALAIQQELSAPAHGKRNAGFRAASIPDWRAVAQCRRGCAVCGASAPCRARGVAIGS